MIFSFLGEIKLGDFGIDENFKLSSLQNTMIALILENPSFVSSFVISSFLRVGSLGDPRGSLIVVVSGTYWVKLENTLIDPEFAIMTLPRV